MKRVRRVVDSLKSPKKAVQRLRKKRELRKGKKLIEALEKSIELYSQTKNPKSDFIRRELVRFYQLIDEAFVLRSTRDSVKNWEEHGLTVSEEHAKRLREQDRIKKRIDDLEEKRAADQIKEGLIKKIIIVPEKTKLNRIIFPKTKRSETTGIKFHDCILLPERLLAGSKAEIRETLRHELLHAVKGKGEVTAYAFSYREMFERAKSIEELNRIAGPIIKSTVEEFERTQPGRDKEYLREKVLGAHAAFKAVELGQKYGIEATRRLLTRIYYKDREISSSKQIIELAEDVEKYFELVKKSEERKKEREK